VTAPGPGAWPLSAVATAVLRDPDLDGGTVLRLGTRELVARGVLVVRRGTSGRRGQDPPLLLLPGPNALDPDLPRPLPVLGAALSAQVPPDGRPVTDVVWKALAARFDLADRLRADCRALLAERGLLRAERTKWLGVVPRTRWTRTPSGDAWAGSVERAAAGTVLPATGLLLALDPELARALHQRLASGGESSVAADGAEQDSQLDDALLGDLGTQLDAGVDAGSGADGGGDGGGGGD